MTAEKDAELEKYTFSLEEVFPDADGVFTASFQKLEESYKNALFTFDTNVLLLPYSMRNEGLEQLKVLYQGLISEKRLYIPKRVAREFANNRNKQLAMIYNSLMQSKSGKTKSTLNYPILDSLEEKTKLDGALAELLKVEAAYYKAVDALASTVRGWEWNDPVSAMYSALFTTDVLIDHDKSNDELRADLERRFNLKIPPGYKDSSKDDGGVGDLAIWMSILKLGSEKKQDVIFVTEDLKPDWWNRSNGTEFLPRYELIDEFRRMSEGKTLHIIRFSRLLELSKMKHELIEAAIQAETEKKERLLQVLQNEQKERYLRRNVIRHMPRDKQAATEKEKYFMRLLQKGGKERLLNRDTFRHMSRDEQAVAIKEWFFSNYEDPAESCPYESREGGYQYIWGGPYDAREVIEDEFGGDVPEPLIDEIVLELESVCWLWSGRP